jgi:hypothetical protein
MSYSSGSDTLIFTAKVFLNNQNAGGSVDYVVSMGAAGILGISNAGAAKFIRFRGSANAADSSSYIPSTTVPHWVRITSTVTNIIYEWSADGISWTNIGTVARPTVGAIASFTVNSTSLNTANVTSVYYATVQNVNTGLTIVFDPNKYNRNYSQAGWNDGNAAWSINTGTATTGYKGLLVDETIVVGDGVDDTLVVSSLATTQPVTLYTIMKRLGTGVIVGRAAAATLINDGINLALNNGSALSVSNAGKLRQSIAHISNGSDSILQIDNGIATTGNTGFNNGTYLELLGNGSFYGNHALTATIVRNRVFKIFSCDNLEIVAITGDSIAERLYNDGREQLVQAFNRVYLEHAESGSNLAQISINTPSVWNPFSFVLRSKVGATNLINIDNVDLLVVWAGFNDLGDDVPLGAIDSNDEFTIAGAIRVGVASYLSRKPTLKIVFVNPSANPVAPTNGIGLTLSDYANHILAVCASIGIPCYDMHANCGITAGNAASVLPDNVHPTAAYINNTLAPLIGNFLNSLQ